MKYFPVVISAIWVIALNSSCGNVKNLQYLRGAADSAKLNTVTIPEPIVQKGDLLGISVFSDNPQATMAVTNPITNNSASFLNNSTGNNISEMGGGASGASTLQGFIVSQNGEIQLYKLGSIPVAGKTKKQVSDTLSILYSNLGLLKNPYVDVRFLNYKITVIGEVQKPGSFSIPSDKLSAFEAIGLAGDITVYGRRDNVLVVREINGIRNFGRLNLQDPNVFRSPYYYLQQNDLVVVDVGKNKSAVNNQGAFQTISLAATMLSIAAVLISIFRR